MRIACWLTKATNTHLIYVTPICFHCNNSWKNASQCYVINTSPVFWVSVLFLYCICVLVLVLLLELVLLSLHVDKRLFNNNYYYHHHHHHHHQQQQNNNIVSFVQGIHTHIPETNHVPRRYIVTAILCCLWCLYFYVVLALALLFLYVSTFRSMAVFCSSLTSWFPVMSLTYFFNDLEMVPVAPIITGITLVIHSTCAVFLLRGLYILKSSRLLF